MKRAWISLSLLMVFCSAASSFAQDAVQGSITAGYRFTDVRGRQQKFRELFNLRDGFRLHDLTLYGNAGGKNKFVDSYSLDASGIGGDPFVGSQLKVTKERLYDVRVNYRQSYFS